ncbi:carboxymuconolactone decarboxylase family protein [Actinokineospora enzanensis]|uniref:carboxymuconolactone decarboxylase family protein n=1 Tax=Actinokineospora enzanensis TaxID=155975 RepID=UPI00037337A3|nr:carboxymuconolactone decarboxylase family protein [Actinokineospora enzanensis]
MERIAFTGAAPELYKRLIGLHVAADKEAQAAGLSPVLLGLVRTRASQLNGCAFCVDMHTGELAALGEPIRRVHALAVWEESGFFSEREEAALELTEAMTLLAESRVPDEIYERAAEEFSAEELTQLVWAITIINSFNRLSVTSRTAPPSLDA